MTHKIKATKISKVFIYKGMHNMKQMNELEELLMHKPWAFYKSCDLSKHLYLYHKLNKMVFSFNVIPNNNEGIADILQEVDHQWEDIDFIKDGCIRCIID